MGKTRAGAGRGKSLGFPTLNIVLEKGEYSEGIFAVRGKLMEADFFGIAHFGPRPTFHDLEKVVEIHVFDFSQNVPAGTKVRFETIGVKIRDPQKFASTEDLKKQIAADICVAKKYLQL